MKDIMVHLDGSAEDEIRLSYAEAIATIWGSHLIGIFTNPLPDYALTAPLDGGIVAVEVIRDLEENALKQGNAAGTKLAQRFRSLSVSNELCRFDGTPGALLADVERQARYADLFVAMRPDSRPNAAIWNDMIETVVFGSGRAVLLVPPERPTPPLFRTVLLAWKESREASRAVHEGVDFLANAVSTIILMVNPERRNDRGSSVEHDIANYVSRHGSEAEVITVQSNGERVGGLILEHARAEGVDLVVMGAYGHSRLREWILGGATQHMLKESEFPILMAH